MAFNDPFGGSANPFGAPQGDPFGGQPQQQANPFGGQPQQQAFGGQQANPFGGMQQQQGNPFGGQPQAQGNPFGGQPQQQANPFGMGAPAPQQQANPFGMGVPQQQQASPFGQQQQQQPQQQQMFQQPQQQPNPFGGGMQQQANPFGMQQQAAPVANDPFGNSAPAPAPAPAPQADNPFASWSVPDPVAQTPAPTPAPETKESNDFAPPDDTGGMDLFFSGPPPADSTPAPETASAPPADDSSSDSSSTDSDSDSDEEAPAPVVEKKAEPAKKKKGKKKKLTAEEKAAKARKKAIQNTMQPTMNVNVLKMLKKGNSFLKFGKSGYPKFRFIQLSEDNSTLMWFSKNLFKGRAKTQIKVRDMRFLRLGQTTAKFESFQAGNLKKFSFSIINKNGTSLDLIAKDQNEFRVWTGGLQEVLNLQKNGGVPENLDDIVVSLVIIAGRRSSLDIHDHKTGLNADETAGPILNQRREEMKKSGKAKGNAQVKKTVGQKLSKYCNQIQTLKTKLKKPKYHSSAQYNNMVELIARCDKSIERVQRWMTGNQHKLCLDELWRTRVDLDSMAEMLAAL